jgi:hypothetical protein
LYFLRVKAHPTIAYLAQGKVWLKPGNANPQLVQSPYANSVHEKSIRAQQRNSWKSQGGGNFLSGPTLWGGAAGQGPLPVLATSISRGENPGHLIYSVESGPLCALLASENFGAEEKRLWNNNNFKLHQVRANPKSGDLAFSIVHTNGTANLGIKLKDESGIKELTEGDSVDTSPQWLAGEGRKIIYQSAGVGRDRQGNYLALGPFSLQELDLDSAEVTTLLEDETADFLAPRADNQGNLYFIRRPYEPTKPVNIFQVAKDLILFPLRMLYAIFQFFNVFSMMFTGKKLSTAGDSQAKHLDLKQMLLWGNLVRAEKSDGKDTDNLVPANWQLIRRSSTGTEEILGKNVLAFDLAANGDIVYSNGNAVFHLNASGKREKILSAPMIEQVVFLEDQPPDPATAA